MVDRSPPSLFRPAPQPGVFAVPDPLDDFVASMAEAEREHTLADLRLSQGPRQR